MKRDESEAVRLRSEAIRFAVLADTGYTKVCRCGVRHGISRDLIGKDREIKIAYCDTHAREKKAEQEKAKRAEGRQWT